MAITSHTEVPPHNPNCEPCLQRGLDVCTISKSLQELNVNIQKLWCDTDQILKQMVEFQIQYKRLDEIERRLIKVEIFMERIDSDLKKLDGATQLVKVVWSIFGAGILGLGYLVLKHILNI